MISNHELFENAVASVVDVTSVMIAYTIGIQQSNFLLGVAYALFDAFIVVWMRKPISRGIRGVFLFATGRRAMKDVHISDPHPDRRISEN
jgi:hypothetical protein